MGSKFPTVKNEKHLEKLKDWYDGHMEKFVVLSSDENKTIFLVSTDGLLEIARVFTIFPNRVEISIDHQVKDTARLESIAELLIEFKRVAS